MFDYRDDHFKYPAKESTLGMTARVTISADSEREVNDLAVVLQAQGFVATANNPGKMIIFDYTISKEGHRKVRYSLDMNRKM